jgi:hypothetical protein
MKGLQILALQILTYFFFVEKAIFSSSTALRFRTTIGMVSVALLATLSSLAVSANE